MWRESFTWSFPVFKYTTMNKVKKERLRDTFMNGKLTDIRTDKDEIIINNYNNIMSYINKIIFGMRGIPITDIFSSSSPNSLTLKVNYFVTNVITFDVPNFVP